ncbi:MAG: LamB/YcsF family protein [Lachnospiraceae bacterium]|nr:LamB/YcsF family protein [Lachnospiraceae bacterium]
MKKIDLNCDLGESFGAYRIGDDEKIIPFISSANIGCGFHGGDPLVMEKAVKLCIAHDTAIGAHPGYMDLMGFGRRNMSISKEEAKAYTKYQIGALMGFCFQYGIKIQHVKPHGALYNMAATDYGLAKAIAKAVYEIDKDIILMGLSGSELIKAAEDTGLRAASEVFADRAYNSDGSLVSRKIEGSVIHSVEECVNRILKMVNEGRVKAITGEEISIKADTICVHGDTPEALEFVKAIRKGLELNNTSVCNLKN